MDQVSKDLKLSVQTDIKECVDRISNLPPELIGKILSLLPTKEAVATSVLSPTWKCFWTFITRLKSSADSVNPSFISFMYQFLYRKPPTLDYLMVSCYQMNNIPHLRAWVSAALLVGVKELDLCMELGDATHVLPSDLFLCKSLVKLILSGRFNIEVPATVCLPSLEVLSLDIVGFRDENSLKRLLSGCPSLQKLNMMIKHLKVVHIKAPVLSNLIVSYSGGVHCKMVLETPSLRYFKVNGMLADSFESTDLNQLVEARLWGLYSSRGYKVVTDLIMGLSNVKKLYLSGSVMEGIVKSGCELPKFHNLTTLKLGASNDVRWALLPGLLENSPFLETLVFEDGLEENHYLRRKAQYSSEKATWHAPQKVPYCLLHHLKVIQINHFNGDIEGEEMIQYFIQNRGALKDLTIQYSGGLGKLWLMN